MLAAGSSVEFIDSLENIHIYTPGQRAPSLFVFTIDSLAYRLLSGTILTGFIHWWCQAGRGELGSDAIETSSFQSPIWRRRGHGRQGVIRSTDWGSSAMAPDLSSLPGIETSKPKLDISINRQWKFYNASLFEETVQ